VLTLLRRNRPFSIFLVTQVGSNVGDAVRNVVVPLMVLQLTHAPALVAAVAALQIAPVLLLQVPAGALLDRWDRRRTMLLADLGRGGLTLLIPLTAAVHGPVLIVLFATTVPLSALSCLFGAGFGAITPALVGDETLAPAYALVEGGESLAWVGGPIVAGLLAIAIGAAGALAVDGASFLVSALGLAAIHVRPTAAAERGSLWHEVGAGLRFLLGSPALRGVVLSWTAYGAIGYGLVTGLVFVGSRGGTASPILASLAVSAYAGGSLLGTFGAGWRPPKTPWRAIAGCLGLVALGALAIAAQRPVTVVLGALLFGLGEGFFLIVYLTLRATVTPDELMGRVASVTSLLAQLASSVAIGWMGLALQWANATVAFGLLALAALVLGAWLLVPRPVPGRGGGNG
jgi:MFS family permease